MKNKKFLMKRAKHIIYDAWKKSNWSGSFAEYKRRCSPTIEDGLIKFYCCEETVTLVPENDSDIDAIKEYVDIRNKTMFSKE